MFSRFRGHLAYNVVAYLALFVALGGTAVAAKPLIDSGGVQDESLTGADVQNDALTGDDVVESSLATVGDADRLDGRDSTTSSARPPRRPTPTPLMAGTHRSSALPTRPSTARRRTSTA